MRRETPRVRATSPVKCISDFKQNDEPPGKEVANEVVLKAHEKSPDNIDMTNLSENVNHAPGMETDKVLDGVKVASENIDRANNIEMNQLSADDVPALNKVSCSGSENSNKLFSINNANVKKDKVHCDSEVTELVKPDMKISKGRKKKLGPCPAVPPRKSKSSKITLAPRDSSSSNFVELKELALGSSDNNELLENGSKSTSSESAKILHLGSVGGDCEEKNPLLMSSVNNNSINDNSSN